MQTKRDLILTATCDLITKQGLQSTSMAQITKRAGVGMGTVYNYFENKEVLVNILYSELKAAMSDDILHDYDANQPIIARFLQLWRNIVDYGLRHPREFRLLEQLADSPYIHATHKESDSALIQQFQQLFTEAHVQRMLKDLPLEMMAFMTYGALAALVKLHLAGKLVLDAASIQSAVEACWDAIKR